MKHIYLMLAVILFSANSFAQDAETGTEQTPKKSTTVSLYYLYSDPTYYGLAFDVNYPGDGHNSAVAKISYATMTYKESGFSVNGAGFAIEIGNRTYGRRDRQGFYFENVMSYGVIDFNQNVKIEGVEGDVRVKGLYSYWGLINPALGIKLKIGSRLSVDPFAGCNWKWELTDSGNVYNANVDNFVWKAGVNIGFRI